MKPWSPPFIGPVVVSGQDTAVNPGAPGLDAPHTGISSGAMKQAGAAGPSETRNAYSSRSQRRICFRPKTGILSLSKSLGSVSVIGEKIPIAESRQLDESIAAELATLYAAALKGAGACASLLCRVRRPLTATHHASARES